MHIKAPPCIEDPVKYGGQLVRGALTKNTKKCPSQMSAYLSYIKEINSQHRELPFHCSKGLCMVI